MDRIKLKELLPDELRHFMARAKEKQYTLIDVRQPQEYAVAHIPGAMLQPLMELESQLFDLPDDRALVFYCHSGARSEIAAALAAEAELSDHPVYHLIGGMLAWDGQKLSDFPRVQLFDHTRSLSDLLMTAMDLEKGAYRYYRAVLDLFGELPFRPVIEQLAKAEEAHARMVYALWKPDQTDPPPFQTLFDGLAGDILEGGEPLTDALERLRAIRTDIGLNVLELSLRIEYQAYDLYRNLADRTTDDRFRDSLLSIAQAEKTHMRRLNQAIADHFQNAP
jgi:rhodanese-related sulfurtransferase/rubrerythrin